MPSCIENEYKVVTAPNPDNKINSPPTGGSALFIACLL
jgi:hypothetical protein